jgi:hypothetical protein
MTTHNWFRHSTFAEPQYEMHLFSLNDEVDMASSIALTKHVWEHATRTRYSIPRPWGLGGEQACGRGWGGGGVHVTG